MKPLALNKHKGISCKRTVHRASPTTAAQTIRRLTIIYQRERTFTANMIFHCRYCAATFANRQLFNAHEERHRKLYPCRICHTHYPTRYALFRHAKKRGHYINKTENGALPANHHIAFKGREQLTKGPSQFGRSEPLAPPEKQRELSRRQILDIYRPRVSSTRVIDCRVPRLRTVLPPSRESRPSTSGLQQPPRKKPTTTAQPERSYSTISVTRKGGSRNTSKGKQPLKKCRREPQPGTELPAAMEPQPGTELPAAKETEPGTELPAPQDQAKDKDKSSHRHTTKYEIISDSESDLDDSDE